MKKYYITFGSNHYHPLGGYPMKDFWVEVFGINFEDARQKVVAQFGEKWSWQYEEDDFHPTFFPKGCHHVIK